MPLHEADVRQQRREGVDVADRPAQGRLQDDADVLVALGAQLAVQLERVRGRRRVLHVDPDEVAALGCVADDLEQVRAAELVREVEPEARSA